jgi:FkbM family methyltransferase
MMISYAQNREDVLLHRLFGGLREGFYIDVGANDPVDFSVTKHFYDAGWRGVNVEPLGPCHGRLCAGRPRDVNLNVGLGRTEGTRTFYELPQRPMLSTFSTDQAAAYRDAGLAVVERAVPVLPLAAVCGAHVAGPIHFLSVDVEGFEREVLAGADWGRWRPLVVLVEATRPNTAEPSHADWEPLLLGADYRFAYFDGLNRFYVRAENPELLEAFRVPVHVGDDYVWYPHQRQLDEIYARLAEMQARLLEAHRLWGETGARLLETQRLWGATDGQLRATYLREAGLRERLRRREHEAAEAEARLGRARQELRAALCRLVPYEGLGPASVRLARLVQGAARRFPHLAQVARAALCRLAGPGECAAERSCP